MIKSILQANEANARYKEENHSEIRIANTDNDVDFNDKIVNDNNESNTQLESLLTEIDDHGEEFLH